MRHALQTKTIRTEPPEKDRRITKILAPLACPAPLLLAGCTAGSGQSRSLVLSPPSEPPRAGLIFVETAPRQATSTASRSRHTRPRWPMSLARTGLSRSRSQPSRPDRAGNAQRYALDAQGRRSPVSVGVSGSTGSYGGGVGVGIGINLGGGPKDQAGTELARHDPRQGQRHQPLGRPRRFPTSTAPCTHAGERPDGRLRPVPRISRQ